MRVERMIKSRIVFLFLLVCGLVTLGSVSAQQRDASRIGWISDKSCGTQHTKAGRADCAQKCWRGSASVGHPEWKLQRAVFVADDNQAIWIVENPKPLGTSLTRMWCWRASSILRRRRSTLRRSPPLRPEVDARHARGGSGWFSQS